MLGPFLPEVDRRLRQLVVADLERHLGDLLGGGDHADVDLRQLCVLVTDWFAEGGARVAFQTFLTDRASKKGAPSE